MTWCVCKRAHENIPGTIGLEATTTRMAVSNYTTIFARRECFCIIPQVTTLLELRSTMTSLKWATKLHERQTGCRHWCSWYTGRDGRLLDRQDQSWKDQRAWIHGIRATKKQTETSTCLKQAAQNKQLGKWKGTASIKVPLCCVQQSKQYVTCWAVLVTGHDRVLCSWGYRTFKWGRLQDGCSF